MSIKRLGFCLIIFVFIISISSLSFASASAHCFGNINLSTAEECVDSAILGFDSLNYSPVYNTYGAITKEGILNWIHNTGNGYGFSIRTSAGDGSFLDSYDVPIYPSDITGNWDLVFLDCAFSAEDSTFAQAFKTVGYSNRGFIGWRDAVSGNRAETFSYYLWNVYVTTRSLNSAVSSAAVEVPSVGAEPRYFGDTSWYGYAR